MKFHLTDLKSQNKTARACSQLLWKLYWLATWWRALSDSEDPFRILFLFLPFTSSFSLPSLFLCDHWVGWNQMSVSTVALPFQSQRSVSQRRDITRCFVPKPVLQICRKNLWAPCNNLVAYLSILKHHKLWQPSNNNIINFSQVMVLIVFVAVLRLAKELRPVLHFKWNKVLRHSQHAL